MRKLMVAIAALFLLGTATLILAQRVTGEQLFQQGLDQERGKRDIPAAIKIYERILKDFPSNRALLARTLVALGDCYERLGEQKAQEYYQQVIAKYPEQTDMVAKAKASIRTVPGDPPSVREFGIPGGQNLNHGFRNGVEISPDGQRIAFVASPDTGINGERKIYLKDQFGDATPIPGAGYGPFFSPDGQWLGFFSGSPAPAAAYYQINKIALSPGSQRVVLLRQVPQGAADTIGASWGKDGTIVFGSFNKGLQTIPDTGGAPQPLTSLDRAANETSHRLPHFLPDGSGVIFTVVRNASPAELRTAQIWFVSLKTQKRTLLLEDGTDARLGPNNTLLFAREGQLFAAKFDAKTLSISGPPVLMNDVGGVTHSVRFNDGGTRTGAAQYSVSTNGTLVYARGSIEPGTANPVVWVDQLGKVTPLDIQPRAYFRVRVSPDGKSILISGSPAGADLGVWLFDTSTQTLERQIEGDASHAEWETNTRFAFVSYRDGPASIYGKDVHSPGIRRIGPGSDPIWTPDKGWMNRTDLRKAVLDPTSAPQRFSQLSLSPDGHWLAYLSTESGSRQVYVKPYPGPGPSVQVSGKLEGSSRVPRQDDAVRDVYWSRNSQALFYRSPLGLAVSQMVLVKFSVSNGQFIPEPGTVLFSNNSVAGVEVPRGDVAPDGRFVMILPQSPEDARERLRKVFPSTLTVVLNWSTELQRALNKAR